LKLSAIAEKLPKNLSVYHEVSVMRAKLC